MPGRCRRLLAWRPRVFGSPLAGGVVVGLDVGGLRTYLIDRFEFENDGLQPSYGSEASASPVAEDTLADVEDGSGLRFVSAWTDTHKITARCSGGIGRGATQALVAIDSAERCAITAIRTDRTRKVAVVDAVEVGTYDCFVAGVSECSRR